MSTVPQLSRSLLVPFLWVTLFGWPVKAHDKNGHQGPTYEVSPPTVGDGVGKRLLLTVVDQETQEPMAARFSLVIDGEAYTPPSVSEQGLRFVSIHQGKGQKFVATFARGTGDVEIPLPEHAESGIVSVAKGYEYLSEEIPFEIQEETTRLTVFLQRWVNMPSLGWLAADEHVHYERTDPEHDGDWLTMLSADDLAQAHFLVLKGGNLPGVWAQQFAFGKEGEAWDGERLIRPGEEYRDSSQGHINLLGIEAVIPPILTGDSGENPYNYPGLYHVLKRSRALGGIGGPAHGTALGRRPTGILDTVLQAVDFFEISNTHLFHPSIWYRLMNCGFLIPPAAGTDLPNYPYRDDWQPLLGETRMYVRTGRNKDFESWKQALLEGKVFISSGPMIEFTVGEMGPGGTVHLPKGGGQVVVAAELASPRGLKTLELIVSGQVVPTEIRKETKGRVTRWRFQQQLQISRSCWLAARGLGVQKGALANSTGIKQRTLAHTAAVRVLVGGEPIHSVQDARWLLSELEEQKQYYRTEAQYQRPEHRLEISRLYDRAIDEIERLINR